MASSRTDQVTASCAHSRTSSPNSERKISVKKHTDKAENLIKIGQFLDLGYKDYIGARVLLMSGLLLQGAILGSTAVEKYLKAILAFKGNVSHGHLKTAHINAAKNFDSRLEKMLNDKFLLLLQRVYEMRYIDSLSVDFNVVIAYREFLAELDFTCQMLHESFKLNINGAQVVSSYHIARDQKDELLCTDNFVANNLSKQGFIGAEDQQVYEARLCRYRGLIEISYTSAARVSDGDFTREGMRNMDDTGASFMVSLAPMVPGSIEFTENN